MSVEQDIRHHYNVLKKRVEAVARKRTRVSITDGVARTMLVLLLPLLVVMGLDHFIGLHYLIRAAAVVLTAGALLYLLVRRVILPMLRRFTLTESAMMVELGLPELNGRVVSSLECYEDFDRERPHFDRGMVCALLEYAHDSTEDTDFGTVINTRVMRRNTLFASGAVLLTVVLAVSSPNLFGTLFNRFVGAFDEVGQLTQKLAGANIEVDPGDVTVLRGSEQTLSAQTVGFSTSEIRLHIRQQGEDEENIEVLTPNESGSVSKTLSGLNKNCTYYFAADKVQSPQYAIKVTDRPRIVGIRAEYEFPRYVKRAPVVDRRSDGKIEGLYGSIVVLTIETNKPLQSAEILRSYKAEPDEMSLGGKFARVMIKLDEPAWLEYNGPITENYEIHLTCEDGFANADSNADYPIIVKKDASPTIKFVRLRNQSPEHEVKVLDSDVSSVGFYVDASDDYGLHQITFHYKIRDLLSNEEKRSGEKKRVFQMPQSEFSGGQLLRLDELQMEVGEGVTFWAEAADAYDLDPKNSPHIAKTPQYRIAVVTKEEMFEEVLYSDDWSTTWYDPLKVATLSKREIPPRMSPTNEPLGDVAEILLKKSAGSNRVSIENQRMVEDYFNSINVER